MKTLLLIEDDADVRDNTAEILQLAHYRVLTAGGVAAGYDLELLERNPAPVSLSEYWKLLHTHRPTAAALLRVIDTPGLAPSIRERLCQRLQWLRENGALAEG